jgi:hypothetical protein
MGREGEGWRIGVITIKARGRPPHRCGTDGRGAGHSALQVIEMSQIKLHHHDQEDHIVYVARGRVSRLHSAVSSA